MSSIEKTNSEIPKDKERAPRSFIKELLLGPDVKKKKLPEETEPESVLGDNGVSRARFKSMLEKAYDPKVNLKRPERRAVEGEMMRQEYGNRITDDKVASRVDDLEKIKRKDDPKAKDKIRLLKDFFKEK